MTRGKTEITRKGLLQKIKTNLHPREYPCWYCSNSRVSKTVDRWVRRASENAISRLEFGLSLRKSVFTPFFFSWKITAREREDVLRSVQPVRLWNAVLVDPRLSYPHRSAVPSYHGLFQLLAILSRTREVRQGPYSVQTRFLSKDLSFVQTRFLSENLSSFHRHRFKDLNFQFKKNYSIGISSDLISSFVRLPSGRVNLQSEVKLGNRIVKNIYIFFFIVVLFIDNKYLLICYNLPKTFQNL